MGDCATTTATPIDAQAAPALPIYGSGVCSLQSSTGYSRVSIQSWDRCFSDGASGNLVRRNYDSAGDSSCCSTTRCSGVSRGGSMGSMEPSLLKGCLGKYYAQTCARILFFYFYFFIFSKFFLYKKYFMEQGHYNPKIRVMKINDKNGPYGAVQWVGM